MTIDEVKKEIERIKAKVKLELPLTDYEKSLLTLYGDSK